MKTCLHCGKQLRDETTKCFFCGQMADELPQQKKGFEISKKNSDIALLIIVLIICLVIYILKK